MTGTPNPDGLHDLGSLLLPSGRCCSLNCAATLLFLSSCSAAMAVLLICFWDAGSQTCAAGLHTDACLENATCFEHNTAAACCCAAAVLLLSFCSGVWSCWLPCQLHHLLRGHTWQTSLSTVWLLQKHHHSSLLCSVAALDA